MHHKKKAALIAVVCISLAGPAALVGSETAQAQTTLSCDQIESIVAAANPLLVARFNESFAGYEKKLNRRKTLRINHLESFYTDGCSASMDLNVTLKRKIRRDATGTVEVHGTLSATLLDAHNATVCLSNPEIVDMDLSHTTELGEEFYELRGNGKLPDSACHTISF